MRYLLFLLFAFPFFVARTKVKQNVMRQANREKLPLYGNLSDSEGNILVNRACCTPFSCFLLRLKYCRQILG